MLKSGVTLYFVRHGETDWNRAGRYQGQRDIPLNGTGQAQAARNGRVLAEVLGGGVAVFDYVASPLSRARETMEIMRTELMLPPLDYRTDDRLREIHYGHWAVAGAAAHRSGGLRGAPRRPLELAAGGRRELPHAV